MGVGSESNRSYWARNLGGPCAEWAEEDKVVLFDPFIPCHTPFCRADGWVADANPTPSAQDQLQCKVHAERTPLPLVSRCRDEELNSKLTCE